MEKKFSIYGIEDVFLFGNKFVTKKQSKFESINQYFQQQWNELYKKSVKTEIKAWTDLSITEKLKVAKYFGYTLDHGKKGCVSLIMKINGMNDQFNSYKSAINNKIEIQGYQKKIYYQECFTFLNNKISFFKEFISNIRKLPILLNLLVIIQFFTKVKFIRADLLKTNDLLLSCKKEQRILFSINKYRIIFQQWNFIKQLHKSKL